MTQLETISVIEGLLRVRTYYDDLDKTTVRKLWTPEESKEETEPEDLNDIEKFTQFLGKSPGEKLEVEDFVVLVDEKVLLLIESITP